MQRAAFWVRGITALLGFTTAMIWGAILLALPLPQAVRRQSFFRAMSRLCCAPAGIRLRVVGRENVERVSPCVYACNHQSQLDYPIAGRVFPGNAAVMASQVGRWPVIGAMFRRAKGIIEVDREVPVRAVAALAQAEEAIRRDGRSIWMFVEGTRGHIPGRLGKFRRGAFRMATNTGVPIVPVVISPLKPQTDIRARRLTPHEVVLHVLEPVYANGSSDDAERALSDEVRKRMEAVLAAFAPQPVRRRLRGVVKASVPRA